MSSLILLEEHILRLENAVLAMAAWIVGSNNGCLNYEEFKKIKEMLTVPEDSHE